MPIPTLAAPVDPTAYRRYFQKLAEEVILLAWKARARLRIWNYWGSGTWTAFLPFASLTRDGSICPSFRYRLAFGFLFWGIDIGLLPPKRVLIHDGKGFVRLHNTVTGEKQVVDIAPVTEAYDPDEANERP